MSSFDLIVIGAGPGGYVAAIRAAQLGMKVACVEKRGALGGTCLNVGCIPSKALLESSEKYEEVMHGLARHGIKVKGAELDLPAMQKNKGEVVLNLTKGIEGLFKKNKIEWLKGEGVITGPNEVSVGGQAYGAKHILIATGSESMPLKGVEVDEKQIVTSTGALEFQAVPKHLAVIGGGVIGLELGSVWKRLGAKVTVIEYLDRITPGMDGEVTKQFQRILEKQGIEFRLGTKVTGAKKVKGGVELTLEAASAAQAPSSTQPPPTQPSPARGEGKQETLMADAVLLAIGRRAYTQGLGLEKIGVATDERGRVKIDTHFRTSVPSIYAIGDAVQGPMLAHKAEEEGIAAVEIMAGQAGHVNYDAIPGVIYTWPEVATVGKSEEELKAAGIEYKTGKFPFMANSRARATGQTDGFVKILACAKSERVLGVHIIGPQAGTLIAEAVLAMEYGASAEDIARTCHAHPTLNEAVKEAALAVDGRVVHL